MNGARRAGALAALALSAMSMAGAAIFASSPLALYGAARLILAVLASNSVPRDRRWGSVRPGSEATDGFSLRGRRGLVRAIAGMRRRRLPATTVRPSGGGGRLPSRG